MDEQRFPIQFRWTVSRFLRPILLFLVTVVPLGIVLTIVAPNRFPALEGVILLILFVLFLCVLSLLPFIGALMIRKNLKYSIGSTGVDITQGIFRKRTYSIPFAVIHGVYVYSGWTYRLFGLSMVIIDTQEKAYAMPTPFYFYFSELVGYIKASPMGTTEDRIQIPGLSTADALELQRILLGQI
jgi:membrane protein YdbS with pleckstrin-like domain